ncbi:transporter [Paraburkholderia antibiotica]|uniref:Transporter n=1 Tax=Paraburkholderia antibiotica TaxID=2728839 RepID=A0A7X9ZZR5_9BURK|nr:transporter [Paraburkholderia antibiotica]NML33293.1 transporter [Paraburkholderia antibiotica]
MMAKLTRPATVAGTLLAISTAASAIDIYPGDYTILPPGTTLALGYVGYTPSSTFRLDGVGEIPNSSLDQTVGIARVLHYTQIGGVPVAFQAYLPFAKLTDVRVGGNSLPTNNGLGDLTLGATAFLVNRADAEYGTTVGFTMYLSVPTGKYDYGKVGAGAGTVTFTPQLGLIQGLGKNLFLDASLDVAAQPSHSDAGYDISVRPSIQLQTYLRYQFTPATSLSFGYSGTFGGKQYVDDVYTGQKTSSSQLRLFASHMLTPTWQLSAMLGKAVATEGGFKNSYSAQLRVMKIF